MPGAIAAPALVNPLRSPAQLQQFSQAEVQKMGEDIATYRYWRQLTKTEKTATQPHLKELNDRAMVKLTHLRHSHPGLIDQLRQVVAQHTTALESRNAVGV
jgi:hypothetical protein